MKNEDIKMEKWKKILLTIALVFQCLRIVVYFLVTIFQKGIFDMLNYSNYANVYGIPIQTGIQLIISTIIFFIAFFLIKRNDNNTKITKEVISIVLLLPVVTILNFVSTVIYAYFINNYYLVNYVDKYDYSSGVYLDSIISTISVVFSYSIIILAIVSSIMIGKKISEKRKEN